MGVLLYHGSDKPVPHPLVGKNSGFSDLGKGFYLTDNYDVACARASSRARRTGGTMGTVSIYSLNENAVPWETWGSPTSLPAGTPFGLRFEPDEAGMVAWMHYIQACRAGRTHVEDLGSPAITRAWIATEEVEMACSGFAPAEAIAKFIDPAELIVQYCLLDQGIIDAHLNFIESRHVGGPQRQGAH
ncbi:MAG: DUF3990 domain-containing protein [Atopobiaceae bacterium]|nr:DUF3990 domain-containing protein [Atopobiaceae bacterium]